MSQIFTNYGPIVNERLFDLKGLNNGALLKIFPLLDSVQSGPIINQEITSNSNKKHHLDFRTTKSTSQTFPLDIGYPCFVPLKKLEKDYSSFNTSGNCLSHFRKQDSDYLLYLDVHAKERQKIYLSEIYLDNIASSATEGLVSVGKDINIAEFDKIDQVTTSVINDNAFGLFRADQNIIYANLENYELMFKEIPISLTDCCLHNRLIGYFAAASPDGRVYVFDSLRSSPVWTTTLGPFSSLNQSKCQFGNDPLGLLIASDSEIWSADLRTVNGKRKIFQSNLTKDSNVNRSFNVSSFLNVPNTSYIYINCSSTTYLYDERNSKDPVLMWQNMLTCEPTLVNLNSINDLKVLSLLGRNSSNLCIITSMFHDTSHSETFIEGVSLPKHFGIVSSTMDYANRKGKWFSPHLYKHLKPEWRGMATANFDNPNSFCTFTQSKFGKIFYQNFKLKGNSCDENVNLNLNVDNMLEKFENEISKPEKCPFLWKKNNRKLPENSSPVSALRVKPSIRNSCLRLESPSDFSYWDVNKRVKKKCYGIKYSDKYIFEDGAIDNFIKDDDPINVLPKEFHSKVKGSAICDYQDPLAQKIISKWNIDPNNHTLVNGKDSEVHFKRVPSTFLAGFKHSSKLRKIIEKSKSEHSYPDDTEPVSMLNYVQVEKNISVTMNNNESISISDMELLSSTPKLQFSKSKSNLVKTKKNKRRVSGF